MCRYIHFLLFSVIQKDSTRVYFLSDSKLRLGRHVSNVFALSLAQLAQHALFHWIQRSKATRCHCCHLPFLFFYCMPFHFTPRHNVQVFSLVHQVYWLAIMFHKSRWCKLSHFYQYNHSSIFSSFLWKDDLIKSIDSMPAIQQVTSFTAKLHVLLIWLVDTCNYGCWTGSSNMTVTLISGHVLSPGL